LPDEAPESPPEAPSPERQYALVELGGYSLAVDVTRASQIIERPALTPVPNTPEFIYGVCNVRGDIYSIVDLRHLLGFDPPGADASPDPLVILLRGPRYTCGATIEGISELLWIRDDQIAAPTSEIPFISGLYRRERDTILVLDVDSLFDSPEMTQFQ